MGDRPKVRLERLAKNYGAVRAVAGIDLEIRQGEFLTLLGPSGCGKTTTLMMMAGFEVPTSGRIWIDGRDVTDVPSYRRPVNTVFQSYALFPHMTVYENIAFPLRMRRTPEAKIRQRVGDKLAMVKLAGYEKRFPRELSGGQQQRVALARSMVGQPEVLLLDEPLGALDLRLRREMQIEIKSLQRQLGITFVYVTHDQEEALTMSDRIAVMNDGLIEQVGTSEEIYERPVTRFVAEFIGETNLLPATLRHAQENAASNASLWASVRPERIRDARPDEPGLAGCVVDRIYVGSGIKLLVSIEGHESPVRVFCAPGSSLAGRLPGETVRLAWDPGDQVLVS